MVPRHVRVDIWSDVVCPWCFIGKRRLERAVREFPGEVEIVFHSFQLDPSAPTEPTETVVEMLGRRYGAGADAGRRMIAQVEEVAAGEGLVFRQAEAMHANTADAHRLLHLALAEGGPAQQHALKEALLSAYFERAENLADHRVLLAAARSAGVEEERARAVLASGEYADAVAADIDAARRLGATGVPFFVVDDTYGISGAQPVAVFRRVLEQAGS